MVAQPKDLQQPADVAGDTERFVITLLGRRFLAGTLTPAETAAVARRLALSRRTQRRVR